MKYDFMLTSFKEGGYHLQPLSPKAERWCRRHFPEHPCTVGSRIEVTAEYIKGVVAGILKARLTINT